MNPTLATSVRGRLNRKPGWDVAIKSGSGVLEPWKHNWEVKYVWNWQEWWKAIRENHGKPTKKTKLPGGSSHLSMAIPNSPMLRLSRRRCVILERRGAPESAAVPLPRINSKAVPSHSICRHSRKPTPRGSRKRFKNNRTSPASTRLEIAYSGRNYDQSAAPYDCQRGENRASSRARFWKHSFLKGSGRGVITFMLTCVSHAHAASRHWFRGDVNVHVNLRHMHMLRHVTGGGNVKVHINLRHMHMPCHVTELWGGGC